MRRLLFLLSVTFAAFATVHGLSAVATGARGLSAAQAVQKSKPRYAVILVLDGARPDELTMVPMPHLQALERRGITYTQAFVGQELANTPPSHATIGTGMLPKHHGVEGFLWEDPRTHLVDNPTARTAVERGQLEQVISQSHVPTLAGRIKGAHPHATVMSVSAHKCYAADAMGTHAADYILCALIYHDRWVAQAIGTHRPPPGAINNPEWDVPIPPRTAGFGPAVQQWYMGAENSWTARYALWAFNRVHYPRVLMINFSETDVLGHFTTNPAVFRYLMSEFDALLGQIESAYQKAGILGQTDFVITADHGMTPIRSILPASVLSDAIVQAGATPVYTEQDTAAAIGIREDSKARAVALNIFHLGGSKIDATYYKVRVHHQWRYRLAAAQPKISAPLRSAYRRLVNTAAAAAGPDVFAVYAPNVSSKTVVASGYTWQEGHLGPQWSDQHIPLVLAGPGIKAGATSAYPARLVDIAPTVEQLLGARSSGLDGVVLADALQAPGRRLVAAQHARGAVLSPVVQALEQRSGL